MNYCKFEQSDSLAVAKSMLQVEKVATQGLII